MKYTGKRCMPETDEDLMDDEIYEVRKWLYKYNENINTLLPKNLANEVRKSMINYLVEQL